MIDAWLVFRREKHIDDKHWVCLDRDDALVIANDVWNYWVKENEIGSGTPYDRQFEVWKGEEGESYIFMRQWDHIIVCVDRIQIREKGETGRDDRR